MSTIIKTTKRQHATPMSQRQARSRKLGKLQVQQQRRAKAFYCATCNG